MAKHVVATVDEIPPGERKIIELEGRSLGVFNINGEFYAVRNICPHQGAPLCEGRLTGLLESNVPGEYKYTRKGEILRCVWHGWEFDIKTGQSWWNPAQKRVRKYPVEVEDGATVTSGLQKGPYTAETYSVSVDQQYVVINMPE